MNEIRSHIISLILSLVFLGAYFIFDNYIFLGLSILLVISFVFTSKLSNKIEQVFSQLIFLIIKCITWLLLAFVYLFILIPIARLQKFFTQNPITLGRSSQESYFISRNHIYRSKDLEKPW